MRNNMKTIPYLVVVGLSMAVLAAFAYDWPLDDGGFRYGFGSARAGFLKGVEFGGADGIVRAADDGELVFAAIDPRLPGGYPLAAGSLMAIDHASDMVTIYAGMARESTTAYLTNVRKGAILGRSMRAGNGHGVTMYAYDARTRRYINPLILMPAIRDDRAPVIKSIVLLADGQEIVLDQAKPIRQGSYRVIVDTYDPSPAGMTSAPFEIRVLIDGSERAAVAYDAAWARDGVMSVFGGASRVASEYQEVDGRVHFGPYIFSRGRSVMSIIVADYAGNKREQTYSIIIQ
jgi:hypothetical protein